MWKYGSHGDRSGGEKYGWMGIRRRPGALSGTETSAEPDFRGIRYERSGRRCAITSVT